jgi:hypothetical protein
MILEETCLIHKHRAMGDRKYVAIFSNQRAINTKFQITKASREFVVQREERTLSVNFVNSARAVERDRATKNGKRKDRICLDGTLRHASA